MIKSKFRIRGYLAAALFIMFFVISVGLMIVSESFADFLMGLILLVVAWSMFVELRIKSVIVTIDGMRSHRKISSASVRREIFSSATLAGTRPLCCRQNIISMNIST